MNIMSNWYITGGVVLLVLGLLVTFFIARRATAGTRIETICLLIGGIGVIMTIYANLCLAIETNRYNKIENTYNLMAKWDEDPLLVDARQVNRELGTLSSHDIKQKIKVTPKLKSSVSLLLNYFNRIRVSIEKERVDVDIIKREFGGVILDIYTTYTPWIEEQSPEYQTDMKKLVELIS